MMSVPCSVKVGSDFAGLESGIVALKKLGVEYDHIFSCDNSPSVKSLIFQNYRPHKWFDDVRTRSLADVGYSDLYMAGFPCQPFASGGKQMGCKDRRALADYCLQYVEEFGPRALLFENVEGLLRKRHRNYVKIFLGALKSYGYNVRIKRLDSLRYGKVRQRRVRVYIVGIKNGSQHREFRWPRMLKLPKASPLSPFREGCDERGGLPSKNLKCGRCRRLVKQAYKDALADNVDPRRQMVFVNIDCSLKFRNDKVH